ncbi:MAG: UPF0175 family protein [Bryobacterales bacterium]|nr:UPF0175 family protein [Bryobacterales bacterium]
MKLEIEVDVAADKARLQEHLREEAILVLFADRKIPAGKAAQGLGMGQIASMELLKQRGIPCVVYTAEDWESDATAIDEFERRRKAGKALVVSNTTPLVYLAALGDFTLLRDLFTEIAIPREVFREITGEVAICQWPMPFRRRWDRGFVSGRCGMRWKLIGCGRRDCMLARAKPSCWPPNLIRKPCSWTTATAFRPQPVRASTSSARWASTG